MAVDMEFEGLDKLMDSLEQLAGKDTLQDCLNKCLRDIAQQVKSYASVKMARSNDVSKSGRVGSRTFKHAADNIPTSNIKNKNGVAQVSIGWEKVDNSPYFYEKFVESKALLYGNI